MTTGTHDRTRMAVQESSRDESKRDIYRSYVDGEIDRETAERRIGDDWDEVAMSVRNERLREKQDSVSDEEVADLFC